MASDHRGRLDVMTPVTIKADSLFRPFILTAAFIALAGCGEAREFGLVRGTLTVQGQPADRVRVEFHPDAARGTKGPTSSGDTDDKGAFVLTYSTPTASGSGAVVGRHKVVLRDYDLAASETGRGVPVRFEAAYSTVLSTPLDVEVKGGEQELQIVVPPRSKVAP